MSNLSKEEVNQMKLKTKNKKNRKNTVYLITGPCGVGKSTIAKEIAKNMENSALIEGDRIYHMVIGGYVKPWNDDGVYLELFWDNVIALTENFIKRGITVVIDYIIYPEDLKKVVKILKAKNVEIKYTVLIAEENALLKRDNERNIDCQMGARSIELLNEFKNLDIKNQYILDTTDLNIEECGNRIITDKGFIV